MTSNSKWIWQKSEFKQHVFCDFSDSFNFSGEKAVLKISADTTYAVYLNGKFTALGQYPDFPYHKVYDEIDITKFCVKGNNLLSIVVFALGESDSPTYYPGNPALRYEVLVDCKLCTCSTEKTQSRISRVFDSTFSRIFSGHIPFSMHCDLTKSDDWMAGVLDGFSDSTVIDQSLDMFPRPISKTEISSAPVIAKRMDIKENVVFDLGREETGYICFSIDSPCVQRIVIGFGEWLINNERVHFYGPRRSREFSFEFTLKEGKNVFFNPLFRVGIRYIQIDSEKEVSVNYVGMYTSYYKVDKKPFTPACELDRRIYDVCVHTLECCMHEHYEDCPTREQGLYALDSRNQMLCGYYAFGEYPFPRASLQLMSLDRRDDGLLTLTVPRKEKLAIPSFALFYILETYEYVTHSKDTSIIGEAYEKLHGIINTFINHMDGGLLPVFTGQYQWNFYEWTDGLSGKLRIADDYKFDTPLNCLFVLALKAMHRMNEMVGRDDSYLELANTLKKEIYERLYDKERGMFVNSTLDSNSSELSNSLAILCGAVSGKEAEDIANILVDKNNGITEISLSMICFKYDALIKVGKDAYNQYILADIRARYEYMLDRDATTFWEYGDTDERVARQGGLSSFCHGWSALPIYYYHTLDKKSDIVKYYE